MKIAFQLDPLSSLKPETDSSLALARAATHRGYETFVYQPENLSFHQGRLTTKSQQVIFDPVHPAQWDRGQQERIMLTDMDIILIRQDPPYDMTYHANTHLLEHLPSSPRVINNPRGIREAPEKLLVTHFPSLIPPTLISNDEDLIHAFLSEHKECVLKPLFAFGGEDVFRVTLQTLKDILDTYRHHYKTPPILQRFLPEVFEGDRRILLLNGEPVGQFLRRPQQGDFRSNTRIGGQVIACDLRPRDIEICQMIGPTLRELGLYFVGIDVIGEYLTEINVTSPTGIMMYKKLTGMDIASLFWDQLGM